MTSPPQPHRHIHHDLTITGISSGPTPNPKRQTANRRQREAAEQVAAYERWRAALIEHIWGRQ